MRRADFILIIFLFVVIIFQSIANIGVREELIAERKAHLQTMRKRNEDLDDVLIFLKDLDDMLMLLTRKTEAAK